MLMLKPVKLVERSCYTGNCLLIIFFPYLPGRGIFYRTPASTGRNKNKKLILQHCNAKPDSGVIIVLNRGNQLLLIFKPSIMSTTAVMSTKDIINSIIESFESNDVESVLNQMTDDVEWQMIGDKTISGKDEMRKFFADNGDMKMISSTKNHTIIDGDHVAVDGEVQCSKNGEVTDMYYCDIYQLENEQVKKMISYIVNKKKKNG